MVNEESFQASKAVHCYALRNFDFALAVEQLIYVSLSFKSYHMQGWSF